MEPRLKLAIELLAMAELACTSFLRNGRHVEESVEKGCGKLQMMIQGYLVLSGIGPVSNRRSISVKSSPIGLMPFSIANRVSDAARLYAAILRFAS